MRTQLDLCGEAQLVDHTDLEGLVVVAAQHVLDRGDVDGRVLLRALLPPGAWRHRHNIKPSVTPPHKHMYYVYKYMHAYTLITQ